MLGPALVVAFVYLWINVRLAAQNSGAFRTLGQPWHFGSSSAADAVARTNIELSPRVLKAAVLLICAGVALFFATSSTPNGILTFAFVMAGPSESPTRFSVSMSDFTSFICLSMSCCKAA